jgi:hypothetical protein
MKAAAMKSPAPPTRSAMKSTAKSPTAMKSTAAMKATAKSPPKYRQERVGPDDPRGRHYKRAQKLLKATAKFVAKLPQGSALSTTTTSSSSSTDTSAQPTQQVVDEVEVLDEAGNSVSGSMIIDFPPAPPATQNSTKRTMPMKAAPMKVAPNSTNQKPEDVVADEAMGSIMDLYAGSITKSTKRKKKCYIHNER